MTRRNRLSILSSAALLAAVTYAAAQQPNFSPAIYGDGKVWGTKAVTVLPSPNPNAQNHQSFDKLFVIGNSNNPAAQLPVSEAAPGNPYYNGGRWFTHTVEWTQTAFGALGTVPILTSYGDILQYESIGYLTITPGSPGPPLYFLCPLLPVK